jgi:AcrR family transcriptional regulator
MTDTTLLRSVADKGKSQIDRSQFQRYDWLAAGMEVFIKEGIDAVRITRLADELGVTRGSFYWHFANRDDLITALVDYWQEKNTSAIVASFDNISSLKEGIFEFFDTCLDVNQFDPRLDLAIREWARRSKEIRDKVDEADKTRVQAITDFFARFAYPMPEAFIRARVLYFSQIGFYALDVKESLSTRVSYTESYYQCFTGRTLRSDEADNFRGWIFDKYGELLS